jgi:DNA-binding MarR family transcriptional regulator
VQFGSASPGRRAISPDPIVIHRSTLLAPGTGAPLVPGSGAAELVDVVNLVMQAVWADMRRSTRPIEPTQWATLRLIAAGRWTVGELARHKGVSLPTMSKSVDMLARRGWVERAVGEADRRQTVVRLTDEGRQMLADCRRQVEDLLAAKLAVLSDEEREVLTVSLRRVRDVLRPTD